MASQSPHIAAQWHETLNGNLTPEMVTLGRNKKVWRQCEEGHVWKAVVYSCCGKQKCGVPYALVPSARSAYIEISA